MTRILQGAGPDRGRRPGMVPFLPLHSLCYPPPPSSTLPRLSPGHHHSPSNSHTDSQSTSLLCTGCAGRPAGPPARAPRLPGLTGQSPVRPCQAQHDKLHVLARYWTGGRAGRADNRPTPENSCEIQCKQTHIAVLPGSFKAAADISCDQLAWTQDILCRR